MKATARQRRREVLVCVFLVLAVLAVFGQTAQFEFVNYDDAVNVFENPIVADGLSGPAVASAFTHQQLSNWIPLTTLSHMLDCQLFGLHAAGHHLVNVLLHAANAVLLFLILRQMTGSLWRSAFVAAVFALHPLRAESVAWVSERKDVLSGFFFMLTIWAYVRYAKECHPPSATLRRGRIYFGLSFLCFALGLMAKSMVATLPFVLLLLDYWPLGRMPDRKAFLSLVREKIPLFVLGAGACLTAALVPGLVVSVNRLPLLQRLGNAVVSCVVYLRQSVLPIRLACLYVYAPNGEPIRKVLVALAIVAGISAAVVVWRKKNPWLLTGWLWFVVMLAPVLGLVQISFDAAHSDRYTYLPGIGLVLAVTWALADWSRAWNHRLLILGALSSTAIGVLAVLGYVQTSSWHDSETLWTQALKCNPDNRFAHYNLGIALLRKDKTDEAIAHFRRAVEIYPGATEAWNNLGQALFQKGEKKEAVAQFRRALEVDSNNNLARCNLATDLAEVGQLDEAADQYRQALRREPDLVMAHNALAATLDRLGQTDEAIAQYRLVLKAQPADIELLNHLGLALVKAGRLDEATQTYREAIRINSRYVDSYSNLGAALSQKGEIRQAIDCWQQCLALQPNQPVVQNKLAWLLATAPDVSLRDGVKAVALAERANDLTSGRDPFILHTLASAYEESKRFPDALATASRAHELARAVTNAALAATLAKDVQRYEAMSQKSNESR
jgi:tetratricopeptide (TPR) repeat protein